MFWIKFFFAAFLSFFLSIFCELPTIALENDLSGLSQRVHKFVLDNGLTCILVRRDTAPIFSAFIRVKVGSIEESPGNTGLAHFFEHMAFKGTPEIGVSNFKAEEALLVQIHALGSEIAKKRKNGEGESVLAPLEAELKKLEGEEEKLLIKNEFVDIYQRNGGVDTNASTMTDYTTYYVSLPSNRLELWAYMESERLLNPVMRQFYSERDVVAEERRMRIDNSPEGRLYEAFLSHAFDQNPYRNPVVGWPQDIQSLNYEVAKKFYETYYIPSRMVVSVVGDLDIKETERIIKKYFGRLPKKEDNADRFPSFELQGYPRQFTITGDDEPRFYIGFHRPAYPHPDEEIFDVLEGILCEGRTSRLYRLLVHDKKIASEIGCSSSTPGNRLDSIFSIYAKPLASSSNKQVYQDILALLEKLKIEKVSFDELEKIKNQVYSDLLWSLKENMGLASLLTFFESLTGDWRYIFLVQEKIDKVTPDDIQRIIKTYFVPKRRVSVFLEKEALKPKK